MNIEVERLVVLRGGGAMISSIIRSYCHIMLSHFYIRLTIRGRAKAV